MIFSGRLRHVVTIQTTTKTRQPNGEEIKTWTAFETNCPADVTPLRGREYISLRAGQSEISLRVRLRYLAGVNSAMRLLWESNPYDIVEVIDVEGRHKELELMCAGPSTDA